MTRVALIGSGTLAQHIAHYLIASSKYTVTGFYDDYKKTGDKTKYGKIIGSLDKIIPDFEKKKFDELIIGIGYNHLEFRKQVFDKFSSVIPFTSFIHDSCYVDPSCKVGAGIIALPGCIFDMNVNLSDNIFFNINCTISHDSKIGSHNFFGPSVKIAGFVKLGEFCFIGIGTTIIDNIEICSGTRTGGGAVITKSISSPGIYVGMPAKFLK